MNLKEEMLEAAGISIPRKSIERLIINGAYFDKSLDYDLRMAVEEGVITSSYANMIRHSAKKGEVINKFFNVFAPMVESLIEEKINYLENELENSTVLEESEKYSEELEDLRKKVENIRNMIC
jgi:hypothetical protein